MIMTSCKVNSRLSEALWVWSMQSTSRSATLVRVIEEILSSTLSLEKLKDKILMFRDDIVTLNLCEKL